MGTSTGLGGASSSIRQPSWKSSVPTDNRRTTRPAISSHPAMRSRTCFVDTWLKGLELQKRGFGASVDSAMTIWHAERLSRGH